MLGEARQMSRSILRIPDKILGKSVSRPLIVSHIKFTLQGLITSALDYSSRNKSSVFSF